MTARASVAALAQVLLAACMVVLAGCVTIGDARRPIGTILVPATQTASERTLLVVLPGFGNDAEDMQARGLAEAVHAAWPEADVMLTSATFAYYRARNIVERLQRDIIEPARAQGYRHIWLAGASIGAMGVVFYEYQHPGELAGLVLLAPWLGGRDVHDDIRSAGGIASWEPGERPVAIDDANFERELWRVVHGWSADVEQAGRVWLICGAEDRLIGTSRLMAPALPDAHYVELPEGAHDWPTFLAATERIIRDMRRSAALTGIASAP